jgi:hypothetical protein
MGKHAEKPTTANKPNMTHAQRQYLLKEMRSVGWYNINVPKLPVPAAVRAAEKRIKRDSRVVKKHASAQRRLSNKLRRQYNKLQSDARQAIYFGTPEKALAAVHKLLKFCRKS